MVAVQQDVRLSAEELVATGMVTAGQLFRAATVLERLNDRGAALDLTLHDICEVMGFIGGTRVPWSVERRRAARA